MDKINNTIDNSLNFLGDFTYTSGEKIESACRKSGYLPQYKYFTRPVYKYFVEKVGPVIATAIAFLSADLVLHQLLPQAGTCLKNYAIKQMQPNEKESSELIGSCKIYWFPIYTIIWMALAIPVMYVKFKRFH